MSDVEAKRFIKDINFKFGGGKIIGTSELGDNNNLKYYSIEYSGQNTKIKYEYINGRKIWIDQLNSTGMLLDEKTTIESIKQKFGKEVATIMLDFYGSNEISDDDTLTRIRNMKESINKKQVMQEIYTELKPAFDFLDWCALHTGEKENTIQENSTYNIQSFNK